MNDFKCISMNQLHFIMPKSKRMNRRHLIKCKWQDCAFKLLSARPYLCTAYAERLNIDIDAYILLLTIISKHCKLKQSDIHLQMWSENLRLRLTPHVEHFHRHDIKWNASAWCHFVKERIGYTMDGSVMIRIFVMLLQKCPLT